MVDNSNVTSLLKTHKYESSYIKKLDAKQRNLRLYFADTCKLKCQYCVSNMHIANQNKLKSNNVIRKIGLEKYIKNIERLIKPYLPLAITFGGPGEPTESPYFHDLAINLFKMGNSIQIQTNILYSKIIERFLKCLPEDDVANRVSFSISYHLGAFLDMKRGDLLRKQFLQEHYPRIAKYGCKIIMITPLTPKVLSDEYFENDYRYMKELHPFPNRFHSYLIELGHIYKGERWPNSYTEKERERVYELMSVLDSKRTIPLDHNFMKYMSGPLYLKGMPCFIRVKCFVIGLDGSIWYCHKNRKDIIGNIKSIKKISRPFLDKPIICPHAKCDCKAYGYSHCLFPLGISLDEYYFEHFKVIGKNDFLNKFKPSKTPINNIEIVV